MVRIEITDEDAAILRSALEAYLSDLRMEIADTDSQDFREMLKERKAALRRVLDRLGSPEEA